jgi:hypothetical protein
MGFPTIKEMIVMFLDEHDIKSKIGSDGIIEVYGMMRSVAVLIVVNGTVVSVIPATPRLFGDKQFKKFNFDVAAPGSLSPLRRAIEPMVKWELP